MHLLNSTKRPWHMFFFWRINKDEGVLVNDICFGSENNNSLKGLIDMKIHPRFSKWRQPGRVKTTLAGSPGFPEEELAAGSAILNLVIQASTILLLFLRASIFFVGDCILIFVEFIKHFHKPLLSYRLLGCKKKVKLWKKKFLTDSMNMIILCITEWNAKLMLVLGPIASTNV